MAATNRLTKKSSLLTQVKKHRMLYLLIFPGLIGIIIFNYIPMYGLVISFQDFYPFQGIKGMVLNPNWVGLKHFIDFFDSYYLERILVNTLIIKGAKIFVSFAAAIIFALLLDELRNRRFKRIVQTISYLPHFLSWVVLSGLVVVLLSPVDGLINEVIVALGGESRSLLGDPKLFREIIVISHVWKEIGWMSIIYLATLAGIDPALYESAKIDGATRFQKSWYISIPSVSSIAILMLILSIGQIMNAGFEQVLLLYSVPVYKVGDIIDTYIYREGLLGAKFSYSTAIGLFKNVVALILILITNFIVKKMGKEGIW